MSRRPPNVLFLMSDEHRADVSGFGGDPVVRTPVLDRLAERGTVFDRAYTPSPICIPGRQSMMAGQLPLTTGCRVYGEDLPPGHPTWARSLAERGYTTAACGKLHHVGTDQFLGWTNRIGSDAAVDRRFFDPEWNTRSFGPGPDKWSDAKEVRRAGIGRGPHTVKDDYTVAGALDFIEEYFASPAYDRPRGDRPLLLKVSLVQPHYPYLAEADLFRYYLNRVAPYLDQQPSPHPFLSQRRVRIGDDVSEREVRRATAAYYAMIEAVDRAFGRVVDRLAEVGQDLDDWIVVYTSDHGEMLGEHGVWEKQKFYEASARVPLVVCPPRGDAGQSGPRRVSQNVNLCDLFATLCELTGTPTPDGLDSRSLVPLLHGHSADWGNETVSQFGRNNLMILQDDLKYQWYGPDMPEVLFDLAADPTESKDFIDDRAYAAAVDTFRARRDALGYGPDPDPRPYVNAGYTSPAPGAARGPGDGR